MRRALLLCLALLALPASAHAAARGTMTVEPSPVPGAQRLHFEFGPVHVTPGQNDIRFEGNDLKPPQEGWIVGFKPDLEYMDGTMPRVDVIHLHHAVWISRIPAAVRRRVRRRPGPRAGGLRLASYQPSDNWIMNHMIHNLTPTPTDVCITYDLDFIPAADRRPTAGRDV